MARLLALLSSVLFASCAATAPWRQAEHVAAMPGAKDLRVGLIMLGEDARLLAAFDVPPAPGGSGPVRRSGVVYAEHVVMPMSVSTDAVRETLRDLGAFTDIVPLPFDRGGMVWSAEVDTALREDVWPLAIAQQLDAILIVRGLRDDGLLWADADDGLVSLDTLVWGVAWPLGLLIPDRSYRPEVSLQAELLWPHDAAAPPLAVPLAACVRARSLHPWGRAAMPWLGLLLPPAWLADDRDAVATTMADWSRAMLPIELAREVKQSALPNPGNVQIAVIVAAGACALAIDSTVAVASATLTALPRGALVAPGAVTTVAATLDHAVDPAESAARHRAVGTVPLPQLRRTTESLLRVRVTLASGEVVSRTLDFAALH